MDPDEILSEGADPQVETPAQPQQEEWTPPSREQVAEFAQSYFALQQRAANLEAAYAQAMAEASQSSEEDYDPNAVASPEEGEPLDVEGIRRIIREEAMAAQNQALAENPMIQSMYEQRGQAIADSLFDQWQTDPNVNLGEFDRTLALKLANSYGASTPDIDPRQALWLGAQEAKAYRGQERNLVAKQYEDNLKSRLEAPKQQHTGTAKAAVEGRQAPRDYEDVAKDFVSRRSLDMSPN